MPRYGFNFNWIFNSNGRPEPEPPNLRELDMVAELGFDFVRIPADYRYWTHDFDYLNPDLKALHIVDKYLEACRERGLHMCFNLHRAPGYCINKWNLEKHNLWTDRVAQAGFIHQWETFARMYKRVPSKCLSFDLVNEPPSVGERSFTRDRHADLIRRTVKAIRAIDPDREIVIDGLAGGNLAVPELADLDAVHSGRGYQPMNLTHYRAPWWKKGGDLPEPIWPGTAFRGRRWDRDLLKIFYAPWRTVEAKGTRVHIGEFGCFKETPNDVALAWFEDLLGIFREFRWGYALWNFRGPFGIIDHGRPGTKYEDWRGLKLDRKLLELFRENRVGEDGEKPPDPRKDSTVLKRQETRMFSWD
jgi:aryl-phospho-beta-D-glucosidase BglC (GH1 family)